MKLLRSIQKCTKKISKRLKTCTGSSSPSKPHPPMEFDESTAEKSTWEKLAGGLRQSEKKQRRIQDVRLTIIGQQQGNALSAEEQEKRTLICTTLGQLPQLTDLTIRGLPPSTSGNSDDNRASVSRIRINDLALILRGTIHQLQALQLRNVTLVAEDSSELGDFMQLIGALQTIHRIDLYHCQFDIQQMKDDQGNQYASAWDELIQQCADLPNLVTLHLTATAQQEMCRRPQIRPITLKQLYNHASLRDLKMEGYAIQANHIQALQAGSKKFNAAVSKLQTFSLECSWNSDTLHALALYVQQQSSLRELNLTMAEEHNHTTKKDEKSNQRSAFQNKTLASNNATSSSKSSAPTTTNPANGPLAVLIRSLAHTHLTRVGLHVPKQHLQSIPSETWQFLWEYNSVLQDFIAPGLSQQIQDGNTFWSNLNKAGRCNLSKTDRVHPDVLVRVLAHPDTNNSVQGLYYFLSATHPCLIR